MWAIEHIIKKYQLKTDRFLVVIEADVPSETTRRNRWQGVYHSPARVRIDPLRVKNATDYR